MKPMVRSNGRSRRLLKLRECLWYQPERLLDGCFSTRLGLRFRSGCKSRMGLSPLDSSILPLTFSGNARIRRARPERQRGRKVDNGEQVHPRIGGADAAVRMPAGAGMVQLDALCGVG